MSGVMNKRWIAAALSIAAVAFIAAAGYIFSRMYGNRIIYGVHVEGVALSNKTKKTAYEKVSEELNEKYGNISIKLRYGNSFWVLNMDEITYSFKIDDVIEKAYSYGRNGPLPARIKEIIRCVLKPVDIAVKNGYNREVLLNEIKKISKNIDRESQDAHIEILDQKVVIHKHITGRKMDIEKTYSNLEDRLTQRSFDDLDIPVDVIEPEITTEKISEIDVLHSRYSTLYNRGAENRSHNIRTACRKLKGIVLLPGDVFSIDLALGPRTEEDGYVKAPVIIGNELIDDIGGGICQVTTTIYNAVLLAGLEIVERSHHSWPLGYVDPGRDATIVQGTVDFKFRNNREYAICINAYADGGTLGTEIWGREKDKKGKYVIRNKILETQEPPPERIIYDNSIEDGVKKIDIRGRKGIKVAVYRERIENGRIVEQEVISIDYYRPVQQVSRVNENYGKDENEDAA